MTPSSEAAAPVFPVPVVRAIIPDANGRVLIVRRQGGAYGSGRWCLPGGKVDYGETVEQALAKELREETALECTSAHFLFYQDSLPLAPGTMHGVNLYFVCTVAGTIALNAESSEYGWIGPDDLERHALVFRHDEALRRYWALS